MAKVLITGAGGYIGSNVTEYFVRRGFDVTGMIRNRVAQRFRDSGAAVVRADLYDFASLDTLFDNRQYDYVIHIAARASDVGRRELFRIANYEAVKRLVQKSLASGVKRFVYLSTSDVYGLHDFNGETESQLPLDESVVNYYPLYKVKTERWLRENLPESRFACVRPCVVWGNGDTSITPRAVAFLKSSPCVIHFGKWRGQNRCALAHVENVGATVLAAATVPELGGREGVHVLDLERTSWSGFYRMLRDKFVPEKPFREITIPVWTIRPLAKLSSGISTLLNRYVPIFDPSDYALNTVIYNIDLSAEKMKRAIESIGERVLRTDEGFF